MNATAGDRVIRFYGTGATSFTSGTTFNQGGTASATGAFDSGTAQAATGSTGNAAAVTPSALWTGQTIALSTRNSITIERPPNPSDLDFILVTVTAQGLGATGTICAPDTWILVDQERKSGSLTEDTFYSFRSTPVDEHYEFDFRAGSCAGAPIAANASAIAVRYTGVNPITPIDVTGGTPERCLRAATRSPHRR